MSRLRRDTLDELVDHLEPLRPTEPLQDLKSELAKARTSMDKAASLLLDSTATQPRGTEDSCFGL